MANLDSKSANPLKVVPDGLRSCHVPCSEACHAACLLPHIMGGLGTWNSGVIQFVGPFFGDYTLVE